MPEQTSPKYRRQPRPNGKDLAFVVINDTRYYLGRFNSSTSRKRYHRLLADWETNGHELPVDPHQITVVEVLARFLKHAKIYYKPTNRGCNATLDTFRRILRSLNQLFGDLQAESFGPAKLRGLREFWIKEGLARSCINKYTGYVKHIFRWAASHELISGSVYHSLQSLEPLKRGRCDARESQPVKPVPVEHVNAIKPFVSKQVWALVQLQLLTGARPGELLKLRPIDLDTTGLVWTAHLVNHKTAHWGCDRLISFGPQAQRIINEYLINRPLDAYLFSPREAEHERRVKGFPSMNGRKKASPRRDNQPPTPTKTDRIIRDCYDTISYCKAVARACQTAGVPRWVPLQLRHTSATLIRKEFGIEAARVVLGHTTADTTSIYAEQDQTLAAKVAMRIG